MTGKKQITEAARRYARTTLPSGEATVKFDRVKLVDTLYPFVNHGRHSLSMPHWYTDQFGKQIYGHFRTTKPGAIDLAPVY